MTEDWGCVELKPAREPSAVIPAVVTLSVSRVLFASGTGETLDKEKTYTVEVRSGDHGVTFHGVPVIEVDGDLGFALDRAVSIVTDPSGCDYEWADDE